jgi:uncharacterized protein (DUF362 family)
MKSILPSYSRRSFLRSSLILTAVAPVALTARDVLGATPEASPAPLAPSGAAAGSARVAIVPCVTYDSEVDKALRKSFDLLGGIGSLVKDKTVTVKVNLTGTRFDDILDRPVGETYMTHYATARALAAALIESGAKRVRFVESTNSRSVLEASVGYAGWDVKALQALGKVEFENTRNLGTGKSYGHMKVPNGYAFDFFEFNHCYEETDVMVSLCKLKQHGTAGITLAIKNQFGNTPNALYGDQGPSEDATAGRGPVHNLRGPESPLPGFKRGQTFRSGGNSIPRTIVDILAARPIHLAIIDGITSISGEEIPRYRAKVTKPGILVTGLNAVSTDTVGTALMGFADPRSERGTGPFGYCENQLLLAEKVGLGTADLTKIEVLGMTIEKARCPYT